MLCKLVLDNIHPVSMCSGNIVYTDIHLLLHGQMHKVYTYTYMILQFGMFYD